MYFVDEEVSKNSNEFFNNIEPFVIKPIDGINPFTWQDIKAMGEYIKNYKGQIYINTFVMTNGVYYLIEGYKFDQFARYLLTTKKIKIPGGKIFYGMGL